MVFGLLKDIKNGEYRTIATPAEIATIVADGHTALVQRGAGEKAGFEDQEYEKAGARLVDTMEDIYGQADFVTNLSFCDFGDGFVNSRCCGRDRSSSPASIPPPTPRRSRPSWTAAASPSPRRTVTGTAPPTVRPPASRAP